MTPTQKRAAAAGMALGVTLLLTACGTSSAGTASVSSTIHTGTVAIAMPSDVDNVARACDGTTAVYANPHGGIAAVANSPACGGTR